MMVRVPTVRLQPSQEEETEQQSSRIAEIERAKTLQDFESDLIFLQDMIDQTSEVYSFFRLANVIEHRLDTIANIFADPTQQNEATNEAFHLWNGYSNLLDQVNSFLKRPRSTTWPTDCNSPKFKAIANMLSSVRISVTNNNENPGFHAAVKSLQDDLSSILFTMKTDSWEHRLDWKSFIRGCINRIYKVTFEYEKSPELQHLLREFQLLIQKIDAMQEYESIF